jgi:hypothetical protein
MFKHLFRWTSIPISALIGVPMAMGATPAGAPDVHLFSTCSAIKASLPVAPDGDYLLYKGGNLFTAYCDNMATEPREYIDLAKTGASGNFSQYTAGGASPGTNVRTSFAKLRINPGSLTVDIGDLTFAASTGSLSHGGGVPVTSMPYSVAMSCVAPNTAAGIGNINLQNTPFQVDSKFAVGGSSATGSATVSSDDQLVDLRGGGFCGWITPAPTLFNPFNPSPGMYDLPLRCATSPVASVPGQICLHVLDKKYVTEKASPGHGMTVLYEGHPVATVNSKDQVRS